MRVDASFPRLRQHHRVLTRDALAGVFGDQRISVALLGRTLGPQWDDKLRAVLLDRNRATARDVGQRVAKALRTPFDPNMMDAWLENNARITAEGLNAATRTSLDAAPDRDAKDAVFEALVTSTAVNAAREMVTRSANFGAHDAVQAAGGESKTWTWSGKGPRHSEMNGETVPMSASFSNGLAWPSDPTGGADEVANCACSVTFDI